MENVSAFSSSSRPSGGGLIASSEMRIAVAGLVVLGALAGSSRALADRCTTDGHDEAHEAPDYPALRVELERAYEQRPSYETLCSLGFVYEALGEHVRAIVSLEKCLAEGGAAIDEERRREVEKALVQLRARVGRIRIASDVDGVSVRVDGRCGVDATTHTETCVSNDRIRHVLADEGRRRITIAHASYVLVEHDVTVASGQELSMRVHGPPVPDVGREGNPYVTPMWIAWSLGAATGAGAIVAGVSLAQRDATPELTRATVALAVGAAIAVGAATYFTVQAVRWKPSRTTEVVWDGAGFHGTF